uniref:WAP four-disulfide core domain 8 n=1 Tax=Rousettus aegyptiacus TaxID=9407 RepID=A0A7J8DMW9_ROUAE|nr:WAP four-disulfide core domain 8 [Rousettus aegyptiacus]
MLCVSLWPVPNPCPSSHPTQAPSSPQLHLLLEERNAPAATLPPFESDIFITTRRSQGWVQKSSSHSSLADILGPEG